MEVDLAACAKSVVNGRHVVLDHRLVAHECLRPLVVLVALRPVDAELRRPGGNRPAGVSGIAPVPEGFTCPRLVLYVIAVRMLLESRRHNPSRIQLLRCCRTYELDTAWTR